MALNTLIARKLFHLICVKNYTIPQERPGYDEYEFRKSMGYAEEFFNRRYRGQLDFRDKSVVDIGCGYGSTCIYMGLKGVRQVVGIDIDEHRLNFARNKLAAEYPELEGRVEFTLKIPQTQKFDIALSFNSFEHYADPENFIFTMKQYLKPNGFMAVAFGPLWKSPWGGHIDFMTRFPWAHLIFPELVIMRERRRFRPDEAAESFEQIRGGLNKMTLRRFKMIITDHQLEFSYFKTNVSRRKVIKVFNMLKHLPSCEEYFTIDVCSIAISKN